MKIYFKIYTKTSVVLIITAFLITRGKAGKSYSIKLKPIAIPFKAKGDTMPWQGMPSWPAPSWPAPSWPAPMPKGDQWKADSNDMFWQVMMMKMMKGDKKAAASMPTCCPAAPAPAPAPAPACCPAPAMMMMPAAMKGGGNMKCCPAMNGNGGGGWPAPAMPMKAWPAPAMPMNGWPAPAMNGWPMMVMMKGGASDCPMSNGWPAMMMNGGGGWMMSDSMDCMPCPQKGGWPPAPPPEEEEEEEEEEDDYDETNNDYVYVHPPHPVQTHGRFLASPTGLLLAPPASGGGAAYNTLNLGGGRRLRTKMLFRKGINNLRPDFENDFD